MPLAPLLLVILATLACADEPTPAEIYSLHCASCHAEDGRGDPRRVGFYPRLDLSRSELVQKGDEAMLYRRITYGYGAMPGFKNRLELQQLLDVTRYTLELGRN